MELIMCKCLECGTSYLTIYKSGDSVCPQCNRVNHLLIGEDAIDALLEKPEK